MLVVPVQFCFQYYLFNSIEVQMVLSFAFLIVRLHEIILFCDPLLYSLFLKCSNCIAMELIALIFSLDVIN